MDKFVEFLYTGDFDPLTADVKYGFVSGGTITLLKSHELESGSNKINQESAPASNPPEDASKRALATLAKLYIMGDLLDVQALKDLAKDRYKSMVNDSWNSQSFSESIRLIYDNTRDEDRDLKNVAIESAQANLTALLGRGDFRSLLKDVGEVALDILTKSSFIARNLESKPTAVKCQNCADRLMCSHSDTFHKSFVHRKVWICTAGCRLKDENHATKCSSCGSAKLVAV